MHGIDMIRQLPHNILRQIHCYVRFRLPGDTAHVLTSVYLSLVHTGIHIPRLSAGYAAHVIADMLIADCTLVYTVLYDSSGKACDATRIHHIFCGGQLFAFLVCSPFLGTEQARRILPQINIFQRFRLVFAGNIDVGAVDTSNDIAHIISRNTACIVRTRNYS